MVAVPSDSIFVRQSWGSISSSACSVLRLGHRCRMTFYDAYLVSLHLLACLVSFA